MSRQHATPILLKPGTAAEPLAPLPLGSGPGQISEAELQQLLHDHPTCLPIVEIDPMFASPVPICRELSTPAGPIDNFLVTPSGLPVLVECKLWRNPEGRREVVGQILDYAKELSRWTASDLQREVSRRIPRSSNPIIELLREAGHIIDEIAFNDALTHNLRRGRFLLLIVGDGIREGVEAIAEYLQVHAGLHFSLGLVEMPVFTASDGSRLVVPRVLARTVLVTREVVTAPTGYVVQESGALDADEALDDATISRRNFLMDVVNGLTGLDPDQPRPRVSEKGWLSLYMPAPAGSCWVSVLVKDAKREVGVRLTSNVNTPGEAAIRHALEDWPIIREQLGGDPALREQSPTRFLVEEFFSTDRHHPEQRAQAIAWLQGRIRDFVAVFRPRIRDAIEVLKD